MTPLLVWFRRDLRLRDNPAWAKAAATKRPIIPIFIWSPDDEKPWPPGAASRWWLHQSLTAFENELEALGSRLIRRSGPSQEVLQDLLKETQAGGVYWNRVYEPALIKRDAKIKETLRRLGVEAESQNSLLLFEPWTIKTQNGNPYQVFTPFWRACLNNVEPPAPLKAPTAVTSPSVWPKSDALKSWKLEPKRDWAKGFNEMWTPGEAGALQQLRQFLPRVPAYSDVRNLPSAKGSSRLSPHLHFGEIGPRQIWHAVAHRGAETYLKELGWREFAHHLLFHFPNTTEKPLNARFEHFPWRKNVKGFKAWQKGETGFPIVDAGMRELWATGWMHNRVRMIAASFLVKDLMIPWQEGAKWFWDTLVDADLANNTMGWQWVAGCGADAAPYYRVFNPALQAERFDPDSRYIRQWVQTPVPPLLDHDEARQQALLAFKSLPRKN